MRRVALLMGVALLSLGTAGSSFAGAVNCKQVNKYLQTGRSVKDVAETMVIEESDVKKCQEEAEKEEHPLNRIISIEEDAHGVVINTTDIHLPRRIGEAVKRAFHGEIEDNFEKDGYFVRVTWTREA